jgi:uncharacterized protein (DUF849 family)
MKTILTCAVTGSGTLPKQTPYLPITPAQIATSALDAAAAGAAIVHLHVRDPETGLPSMELKLYKEVVDRIRDINSDVIINLTCGPGASGSDEVVYGKTDTGFKTAQERTEHIVQLKPELCSLDLNTMNRGPKKITVNSIKTIREMSSIMTQHGIKPELECFDSGDLRIAEMLISDGTIAAVPFIQIATGIRWGWDSTVATLEYAKQIMPRPAIWSAFGIGLMQMPFVALSYLNGGQVRVGLEDNIFISPGELAKTNADLVQKAVRIVNDLGGEIASPTEARLMLGI